jgi:hypothetical protein
MKFHEDASGVCRVLPYGKMEGRTNVKRVVAFCICYTKAPEKHKLAPLYHRHHHHHHHHGRSFRCS